LIKLRFSGCGLARVKVSLGVFVARMGSMSKIKLEEQHSYSKYYLDSISLLFSSFPQNSTSDLLLHHA